MELAEYFSMSLSTLVLGLVADGCGRRKTLFPSLIITCIAGTASAFAFKIMPVFAVLRGVVGFAIGMEREGTGYSIKLGAFTSFSSPELLIFSLFAGGAWGTMSKWLWEHMIR